MGRKKIQIKPIAEEKIRKVTFNRRRNGILKKAYELSILCDTKIVVLMFDQKEMCHVYSTVDGPNAHADMMQKYISKDFCTVDPIRNYDTSPDLQLDDPSQAIWRVSQEKVAIVNTYAVTQAAGLTPNLPAARHGDDDDDDEADGSEQLAVKSSRTYHTKNSHAKGSAVEQSPKAKSKARSPHRSISPDLQYGQLSPRRSPRPGDRKIVYQAQEQPQLVYQPQQGLGITGSGYTPLLRPEEYFNPVLYPSQIQPLPAQYMYGWPSPALLEAEAYGNLFPQTGKSMLLRPDAHAQPHIQQVLQSPLYTGQTFASQHATPVLEDPGFHRSPKKEQAHFNHYVYPPQLQDRIDLKSTGEADPIAPTQYILDGREQDGALSDHGYKSSNDMLASAPRNRPVNAQHQNIPESHSAISSPGKRTRKTSGKAQTDLVDPPSLQVPEPERRVTRSQSRSPQMKARELPLKALEPPIISKAHVPLHLRGPSLLDEITFDPDTGAAMMDSGTLASWLGTGISPGHSRETSHVRGESVSQWLNLPQIPE